MAESGFPDFELTAKLGVYMRSATPKEIVDKIAADVKEAVGRDEVRDKLVGLGAVPAANTPAQFSQMIENDRKRYAQIIRERKITIQ